MKLGGHASWDSSKRRPTGICCSGAKRRTEGSALGVRPRRPASPWFPLALRLRLVKCGQPVLVACISTQRSIRAQRDVELTAAALYSSASIQKRVSTALIMVSSPEPATADCSLAGREETRKSSNARQARRNISLTPSNPSIVMLLLLRGQHHKLTCHVIFYFQNQMAQVVRIGPKRGPSSYKI